MFSIDIFYNKITLIYGHVDLQELFNKGDMNHIIKNIKKKYFYYNTNLNNILFSINNKFCGKKTSTLEYINISNSLIIIDGLQFNSLVLNKYINNNNTIFFLKKSGLIPYKNLNLFENVIFDNTYIKKNSIMIMRLNYYIPYSVINNYIKNKIDDNMYIYSVKYNSIEKIYDLILNKNNKNIQYNILKDNKILLII